MTSIDNRIVQMDFHNGSFLSGVSQTIKAISVLKNALNFGNVKNSFDDFDEKPMVSGIEKITNKLKSLGEIGVKAFDLISSKAADVGRAIGDTIEGLAFGEIGSSFGRYEKDVKSVQTIMFATKDSIENVESELERLTWFTDETSYSYTDMVDNISKFTSMKIPLGEARTMMQGIAVWAASAGQGASQASHAMYNLSQAMGAGYVQKLDWRSIQAANMETSEFKENVIQVAKELGALDAQGRTLDKSHTLVTYENFAETLNKKWFSKEVLGEVLRRYGDFADKVYELQQQYYAEHGERLETSEAIKMLTGSTYEFSETAFKAAQEATTFSEAIGAVHDAAATSWLRIYKQMFGNYEQAKEIWTKLSNDLYTIFVDPLSGIEELLSNWHEVEDGFGSWNDFIQGVSDAMDGLIGIIGFVKEQLEDIIPPITIDHLKSLSLAVRDFGASLKETFGEEEEAAEATEDFGDKAANSAKTAARAFGILEEEFIKLDSELKEGSKGKEVKAMQRLLMEAGYNLDRFGADGIFGPETQAALNQFKEEAGLAVDGIYDEATRRSLIEALELKETEGYMERLNESLEKGSKGEDVKRLQRRLIELGFDLDKYGADGIFGPETKKALEEFEKQYGLTIDGIYDEEDHNKIEELMYSSIEKTDEEVEKVNETIEKTDKSAAKLVIQHLSRGFFSLLDIIRLIGVTVWNVAKAVGEAFSPVLDVVLSVAIAIADAFERFDNFLKTSGTLEKFESDVRSALVPVTEWLTKVSDKFLMFIGIKEPIDEAGNHVLTFADIWDYFVRIFNLSGIADSVSNAFERIKSAFSVFDGIIEDVKDSIDEQLGENWFEGILVAIGTSLLDFLETAGYIIEVLANVIGTIIENIPGAIQTLKDFWATLTFEGDESTGQAPGIIARIKNFINDIFTFLFGASEEAEEYTKADSGPVSILTSAFAEENENGNKRVNKSLRFAKGIVSTIGRIIDAIKLLFTGNISDDSTLSEDVVSRINGIRAWFKSISDFLTVLFTGKTVEGFDENKANGIINFRNGVVSVIDSVTGFVKKVYDSIALFISGKVSEGTKLSEEAQGRLINLKNGIIRIGKIIKTVFTGKAADGLDKETAEKAIRFSNTVSGVISSVFNAFKSIYESVYYFFTGNTLNESTLSEDAKNRIDLVRKWLSNLGKKIKYFFSGDVPEGLDEETVGKIDNFKKTIGNIFGYIGNAFKSVFDSLKYLFTNKIDEGSTLTEDAISKIDGVRDWFLKLGAKILYLFTGKETENLDSEAKERLERYQSSITSVFEWIKGLFGSIFDALSYIITGNIPEGSKLSAPVISVIDSIKGFLTSVWNGIKVLFTGKISERGLLDPSTAQKLIEFRNKVTGVFKPIKEAISPFIENFGSTIAVLFSGNLSDRGLLSRENAEKIIRFRDGIINIFTTIGDTFRSIFSAITGFFADSPLKLGSAVQDASDATQDGFIDIWDKSNFNQKILIAGGAIGIIGGLIAFLSSKITKMKESLGIAKKKDKDGESGFKQVAESILKIGIGIGLIAGSVIALGYIDEGAFKRGMSGLLKIAGIVVGMFYLVNEIGRNANSKKNPVDKIGKSIMDLAEGIGILAVGILLLSAMSPETFLSGFWKLGAILVAVAGFLGLLKLMNFEKLDVKGFWDLAAGIEILAITVKTLSGMKIEELGMGFLGLLGIMALVAGLIYVMGKVKANKINIKGFDAIGTVIFTMSSVLKSLAKMKFWKMMQGILGLTLTMAALAGFIFVLGKYGKKLKTSQALVLVGGLAAILLAFAYAIDLTKEIDPLQMIAFSAAFAIALAAFTGALMYIGDKKHGGAKTMISGALGLAASIGILIAALGIIVFALGGINELTNGGLLNILEQGGEILSAIKDAYSPFFDSLTDCLVVVGALFASEIIGKIPGGPKAMIKGALGISVALGILLVASTILVWGLGKLDEIEGLNIVSTVEHGGEIISSLSTALEPITSHAETLVAIAGFLAVSEIIGLIPGGPLAMIAGSAAMSFSLAILVAAVTGIVAGLGKLDEISDGKLIDAINRGGDVLSALGSAIYGLIGGFTQAFENDLVGFADAISSVSSSIDGLNEDGELDADLEKAKGIAETLHTFFSDLTSYTINQEGFDGYMTAADQLSTDMTNFGDAISGFRTGVSGIASEEDIDADTTKAINVAKTVKEELFDVIADQTPDGQGLKDYNDAVTSVLEDVKSFAEAMGSYKTNITGFNYPNVESDTSAAITAATSVANFLVDLNEQSDKIENNKSALDAFFTGDTAQKTVFDSIQELGLSVKSAKDNMKGVGGSTFEADMASTMVAIDSIVKLLVRLKETEATDYYTISLFTDTLGVFEQIADEIVKFNTTLSENNVSDGVTSSIATIMGSVGELVSCLSGTGENRLSTDNFLSGLNLEDITLKLDEFSGYLGEALDGVVSDISGKTESFSNAGLDFASAISDGLADGDLSLGYGLLLSQTFTNLDEYKKSFALAGKNFVLGLSGGIAINAYLAVKAANYVARKTIETVNKTFDSHSPSKVAIEIGEFFTKGLSIGVTNESDDAANAAEGVANSMIDSASGPLSMLSDLFENDIDDNPVITPIIDLTNAKESATMIGGLFGNQTFGVTSDILAKDTMFSTDIDLQRLLQNDNSIPPETISGLTQQLNSLTNYLAKNDGSHASEINMLSDSFGDLASAVTNLKIILDTGTLVGSLAPALDSRFGGYAARRERGN